MSESGLAGTQKLFAIVDGWVRNLRIREVDGTIDVTVAGISPIIRVPVRPLAFTLETTVSSLAPLEADRAVRDGLQGIGAPAVCETGLNQLSAFVRSEDFRWTIAVSTADISCRFFSAVHDFGRAFAGGSIRYEVKTRNFPFHDLNMRVFSLRLAAPPGIREGTAAVQKLSIRRPPLQLSFLSQQEQLVFWKAAVHQTKRTARDLRLVGVYPAIPMGLAGGLRIDSQSGELVFHPAPGGGGAGTRLQDVAIFRDLVEDRVVIVTP
jgi:hypothetical protein